MTLRLYDTLRRAKVPFEPVRPDRISLYVCGPTVYNRAHIGNARPEVVFDVLGRLLKHLYPERVLVHARNVTDIDDKINAAARAQGVPISAITDRFGALYLQDMAALGVDPAAKLQPHATEHVAGIIGICARLIARGHAYAADGHVLFHVPGFPTYGKLSRRSQDELLAGARVDVAPYKRDPADFVLWKPSAPELPGWDSPWGRGRPGWHIECSAMIAAVFGPGETIDIHGGGQDLIFPHHENEIAQAEAAFGAALARVWMHNGFLNMGEEKMSKSLGNIATVDQLLGQGHRGDVLRLALLSAHYRQPLEWTDGLLEQTRKRLDGWYRVLAEAEAEGSLAAEGSEADGVVAALSDDLNTPEALAALDGLARARDAQGLRTAGALLGILQGDATTWFKGEGADDGAIQTQIDARVAAKQARNWAEADRIRDALKGQGILLEDRKDGTTDWRRA
jgi:cysteinyl-tRNA synthetase